MFNSRKYTKGGGHLILQYLSRRAIMGLFKSSKGIFCPYQLVGGFKQFFSIIYGIILPIDYFFSRWLKPPTSQKGSMECGPALGFCLILFSHVGQSCHLRYHATTHDPAGWWFWTWFLLFHSVGNNNHPNWRSHIFQRGRAQPPTSQKLTYYKSEIIEGYLKGF